MRAYDATFRRTIGSFDRLTDPSALNVQPAKVRLVRLPRQMTIEEFTRQYPSTVPAEQVAVINGVDPGAVLSAGQTAKQVVGGVRP